MRERPAEVRKLPWQIIEFMAHAHGLESEMVAAVIMTESAGNPYAFRAEVRKLMDGSGKHQFLSLWNYFLEPDSWADTFKGAMSRPTEWIGQLIGWGPMQVQGTVARERGFTGWFPELCTWKVGIEYGCKHLQKKAQSYGTDPETLYAAYNGGKPTRLPSQMFTNQRNVDNFMKWYRLIRV